MDGGGCGDAERGGEIGVLGVVAVFAPKSDANGFIRDAAAPVGRGGNGGGTVGVARGGNGNTGTYDVRA